MGLFDFLKNKKPGEAVAKTHNLLIRGPRYLRPHLTAPDNDIAAALRLPVQHDVQWSGQLISSRRDRFFDIHYFGDLINDETIVDTCDIVQKIIAVNPIDGQEIILFDKACHGWEGFICDMYSGQELLGLNSKKYISKTRSDNFRIVFIANYNSGTKTKLLDSVDQNGNIMLENGSRLHIQDAFDDAFDAVTIYAVDRSHRYFKIVGEELA